MNPMTNGKPTVIIIFHSRIELPTFYTYKQHVNLIQNRATCLAIQVLEVY